MLQAYNSCITLTLHSSVLDSLVDPLQKTINFKPKPDAVKQEVDRNEDMIRSALRAIASLNRIRFAPKLYLNPVIRCKNHVVTLASY